MYSTVYGITVRHCYCHRYILIGCILSFNVIESVQLLVETECYIIFMSTNVFFIEPNIKKYYNLTGLTKILGPSDQAVQII